MNLIPSDFLMIFSLVLAGTTAWSVDRTYNWLRERDETQRQRAPRSPGATLEMLRTYTDACRRHGQPARLAVVFWLSLVGFFTFAAAAFWLMLS